ncbi:MAG: hypothetical protein IK083_02925 [Abditibacteriota bacterium]|nr:hypothetical protein [Abditibacteriota bacterium]
MGPLDRYIGRKRAACGITGLCMFVAPGCGDAIGEINRESQEALDRAVACKRIMQRENSITEWDEALEILDTLSDFPERAVFSRYCHRSISRIHAEVRARRIRAFAPLLAVAVLAAVAALAHFVIIPHNRYHKAMEYYNAGQYSKASDIFITLGGYKDSIGMEKKSRLEDFYAKAMRHFANGNYRDALVLFAPLHYKDSDQMAAEAEKRLYSKEYVPAAGSGVPKPGDIVVFGSYPYAKDGKEKPVEWLVVDDLEEEQEWDSEKGAYIPKNYYTLISWNVLDAFPAEKQSLEWHDSYVQKWLNSEFLNKCFSKQEQAKLVPLKCVYYDPAVYKLARDEYGAYMDWNKVERYKRVSRDKVVLSYSNPGSGRSCNQWTYFESAAQRKTSPTPYAAGKGLKLEADGCCPWALRTVADFGDFAGPVEIDWGKQYSHVNGFGSPCIGEYSPKYTAMGIRPAICVRKGTRLEIKGRIAREIFGADKENNTQEPISYYPDRKVKRGDIITFGRTDQDGTKLMIRDAIEELIEWIVLDVKDRKILVVSRDILHCFYPEMRSDEGFDDRDPNAYYKYLNETFYKDSFDDLQKSWILSSTHFYRVEGESENTYRKSEKLFSLSLHELDMYFPSAEARKSKWTKSIPVEIKGGFLGLYAEDTSWIEESRGGWFTSRNNRYSEAAVNSEGKIDQYNLQEDIPAVRPAMWLENEHAKDDGKFSKECYKEMEEQEKLLLNDLLLWSDM